MAAQDIGIYCPESSAEIFRYHFRQLAGRSSDNWSYYHDADLFNQSPHQRRVACFQIPYPYNNNIEHLIDQVYASADAVVVLGHPAFYPRFGFIPASRKGLRSEYPVSDDVFMVLEFSSNAKPAQGLVKFRREFSSV